MFSVLSLGQVPPYSYTLPVGINLLQCIKQFVTMHSIVKYYWFFHQSSSRPAPEGRKNQWREEMMMSGAVGGGRLPFGEPRDGHFGGVSNWIIRVSTPSGMGKGLRSD
jgi:hypothetical protein